MMPAGATSAEADQAAAPSVPVRPVVMSLQVGRALRSPASYVLAWLWQLC